MSIRILIRSAAALSFAALIAGCSSGAPANPAQPASHVRSDDCVAEPSRCRYEAGEREFAEQEAKRLNRESARKLRRSSWW
ncbi:hypothetical protein V8Z80_09485 [Orrella sp. JC864]|uniref:hypothetical protein n=1 Tax=Orrella sp. JC864 TaxID=3120298 RepID=UPI0012BBC1EF